MHFWLWWLLIVRKRDGLEGLPLLLWGLLIVCSGRTLCKSCLMMDAEMRSGCSASLYTTLTHCSMNGIQRLLQSSNPGDEIHNPQLLGTRFLLKYWGRDSQSLNTGDEIHNPKLRRRDSQFWNPGDEIINLQIMGSRFTTFKYGGRASQFSNHGDEIQSANTGDEIHSPQTPWGRELDLQTVHEKPS